MALPKLAVVDGNASAIDHQSYLEHEAKVNDGLGDHLGKAFRIGVNSLYSRAAQTEFMRGIEGEVVGSVIERLTKHGATPEEVLGLLNGTHVIKPRSSR